jgi:hypothetical protein
MTMTTMAKTLWLTKNAGSLLALAMLGACAPDSSGGPANRPNQGLVEVVTAVAVEKPMGGGYHI